MEAWDTLAAVEDGLATLRSPADSTAVIEHLAVVTHRLRGSAALSGFPQVAGLAAAMEEAVERVAVTPPGADRPSLAALSDMAFWLKTALDTIGETGVEDAEAIAESLAGLTPSTPPPPADETSRRLAELDRFFTDQADVLEYFVPEAVEHLESMAQSLVALEGEGATESEIAALFRAVHTLKGAAYTVGCGMVGDLAHRVEDMLGQIREHQRPLDRTAIEPVVGGREAAARRVRPSIRVSLDRLDALMNLVGELVITRSRLERHLVQLEQAGELLSFTQSRMTQTVAEFESKYADRLVPPVRSSGGGSTEAGASPLGEVFDDLEFDRYDDFNLLARRVGEISSDLTEIQHELTGLVRVVREDAGGVQRLSGELRSQITRARMVPVGRLFAPFVRMVRDGSRAAGKSVVLQRRA